MKSKYYTLLLPVVLLLPAVLLPAACSHRPAAETEKAPQQLTCGADVSDAFYTDRLPLIDSAFQRYIDLGVMPHAVTMVVHNGRIVHNRAFGWRDREAGIPCRTDDIFRIASQTKAISVIAFMTLFEEGKVQLDEPVKKYLPEFANPQVLVSYNAKNDTYTTRPAKRDITLRHLITHTSGICYDGVFDKILRQQGVAGHNTLDSITLAQNVSRMATVPLKHDPGEDFTYSYNIDVLGRIAEIVSGQDFYSFLKERVLDPCDMHDTYFHVPADKQDRIVKLYSYKQNADDREVSTLPHGTAYQGAPRGSLCLSDNEMLQTFPYAGAGTFCSPSAGLCGTIEDYAKFCQMILNGGTFNEKRIIGRKTLEMMQKNGTGSMRGEIGFGMAWDVFTPENAHNTIVSEGSMRWGGMFGSDYIIDPKEKLIVLMYVNNMPNLSGFNPKTLMHNVTYQALR
ncbi:MAG: beta-lactamase family protein [Paludibacteraceae bacterium]|nr:beta-lactamase family protein [Paludibacteraceae bacterium]